MLLRYLLYHSEMLLSSILSNTAIFARLGCCTPERANLISLGVEAPFITFAENRVLHSYKILSVTVSRSPDLWKVPSRGPKSGQCSFPMSGKIEVNKSNV